MNIFKLAPVPDGVYYIRSAERASPDLYLERQYDGSIQPLQLNKENTNQQWKITHQNDGTYQIVNFGSGSGLSVLEYTEGTEKKYRPFTGGAPTTWTLDARADRFVIGNPNNGMCVDIATNNWVILWQRWNAINQQWFLESVSSIPSSNSQALPKAGNYKLVNAYTRSTFYPLYFPSYDSVIPWAFAASWNTRPEVKRPASGSFYWTVTPQNTTADGGDYTIFGIDNDSGHQGYLFLPEATISTDVPNPYAQCANSSRTVRVVPSKKVPGAFNIIATAAGIQKTFCDLNSADKHFPAYLTKLDLENERHAWVFEPY